VLRYIKIGCAYPVATVKVAAVAKHHGLQGFNQYVAEDALYK
jgi:hypothetical protein